MNPHSQAINREVDSLRGLKTDIGHGLVSMAKLIEHSLTTVSMEGAKKRMIRFVPKGKLTRYKRLTQLIRRCRSAGGQDGPKLTYMSMLWNVEARRALLGRPQDKTVTARHRETPDREVEQSESCTVMAQIAVARLLQVKALLTFNWCFMARKNDRTCKWKKANERGSDSIVCTPTPYK